MENMTRVAVVLCESGLTDMYYIRRGAWKNIVELVLLSVCYVVLLATSDWNRETLRLSAIFASEVPWRYVQDSTFFTNPLPACRQKRPRYFFKNENGVSIVKLEWNRDPLFLSVFYHAYPRYTIYIYILLSWNAPLSPGCVRVFKNIRGTLGFP